jgi:hypothetical protein
MEMELILDDKLPIRLRVSIKSCGSERLYFDGMRFSPNLYELP